MQTSRMVPETPVPRLQLPLSLTDRIAPKTLVLKLHRQISRTVRKTEILKIHGQAARMASKTIVLKPHRQAG